jgi:hypothetical protein
LLHELAARLKKEMLPGDLWGYMLYEGPSVDPKDKKQLAVLDKLAAALINDDLDELQKLYQSTAALKIPSVLISHNSVHGVHAVDFEESL